MISLTNKNKRQLLPLKAAIKGLANTAIYYSKLAQASSGDKRSNYRITSKSMSEDARIYLIAYGLLRGLSYKEIENKANKDKLKLLNYEYLAAVMTKYCFIKDRNKITKESLYQLLNK